MPLAHNPFSITYGAFEVGGTVGGSGTTGHYLLHGPYAIEKSPERLSLTFDVVVVGSSYEDLQDLCNTLEATYSSRDYSLIINLDQGVTDAKWTYTHGAQILNTRATVRKTGNPESDRGYSRMYTVTIEGELPASDQSGLREFEVTVSEEPTKQKIVTIRGLYQIASAYASYVSDRDTNDANLLAAIDSTYSWEKVADDATRDRGNFNCRFQRQYIQLLSNQKFQQTDSANIVDHNLTFSEQAPAIGSTRPNLQELHRVQATFSCAVDIDNVAPTQKGNLQSLFEGQIRKLIIKTFTATFKPVVFAIEDQQANYDESLSRLSCTLTFVFQAKNGGTVVKVEQSLRLRESRVIDQTPVHSGNEFDAYTAPGWAIRERTWTRTVTVIGEQGPINRIGGGHDKGLVGAFEVQDGLFFDVSTGLRSAGWNIVDNDSEATPRWIGLPGVSGVKQILVTILRETVVERYTEKPLGGTGVQTR